VTRFPHTEIGWKIRALWGSFSLDSWGIRIGKLTSIIVIIAFSVGATFFFRAIFESLIKMEDIGEPLLWRVIPITLATLFAMLVVSNLITGIATIYRSPEIPFLFAQPISYRRIFLSRFVDNMVYSSWSLAVLGIPIIIAWGWIFKISIYKIIFVTLFGLAPFVFIAAEIGITILMGVVLFVRHTSRKAITLLIIIVIISVAGFGYIIQQNSRGLVVEGATRTSNVEHYLTSLAQENRSSLTPPHWLAGSMKALRYKNGFQAFFLCALLTLTSIVWLRWLSLWSERVYYPSWAALEEFTGKRKHTGSLRSARRFTKGWLPNPLNAMLRKDMLEFVRNPSQWGQFLILVAFLLIYLFNLIYVSTRLNFDNPYWKTMVLFLNFAFTGFILATLAVRFVFPLISLEGRGFWAVRSAPVSINLLFWEKFFLAFVVFMGLCEMIIWFTNRVLDVTPAMMMLTTVGTFLMGVALTGLGIGMGSLYPDFKDESPMRIASTPGGVMTVVISLVYVAIMVAILGWPAKGYFVYLLGHGSFPVVRILTALVLVAGVHTLVFLVPVRLGRQALQKRDV